MKKILKISFKNFNYYLEDEKKEENIKFVFNNIKGLSKESLKNGILLENISLSKINENSYRIEALNFVINLF